MMSRWIAATAPVWRLIRRRFSGGLRCQLRTAGERNKLAEMMKGNGMGKLGVAGRSQAVHCAATLGCIGTVATA